MLFFLDTDRELWRHGCLRARGLQGQREGRSWCGTSPVAWDRLAVAVTWETVARSTTIDGARVRWLATLWEGFLLRASTVWCRVLSDGGRWSA